MSFKVQVGPAQIAIHQGQTVLLTETDGRVHWPSKCGLYFRDTRVISAWEIYANGELWDLLNVGAIAPQAARIFLTNRAFETEHGPVAARTLGLVIGRQVDGGLHEDIEITNSSQRPVRFNLEVAVRADFADIFEVKADNIVRRGQCCALPVPERKKVSSAQAPRENRLSSRSMLSVAHPGRGRLASSSTAEIA